MADTAFRAALTVGAMPVPQGSELRPRQAARRSGPCKTAPKKQFSCPVRHFARHKCLHCVGKTFVCKRRLVTLTFLWPNTSWAGLVFTGAHPQFECVFWGPAEGNSGHCPKEPLIELLPCHCPSNSAPQVALPWHHELSFFTSTQERSTNTATWSTATRTSLNRHSASTTTTTDTAVHTSISSGTTGDGTQPPSPCQDSHHTDGHRQ